MENKKIKIAVAGTGYVGPVSYTHLSLFDQPQMHGVNRTPKNIAQAAVKFVDKPQRKREK